MRRSGFLAGGVALATAAAALPARAQYIGTPYRQQLTIAVNVPLSGPLGPYGIAVVNGARAAVDYDTRYSGPLERAFSIRTFDDQGALAIAITNAQFAAGDNTVVATIGGLTADVTVGCLSEYANDGMPLIVPAVTADAVTARGYRNVFRLPTKDTTEGILFARTVLPEAKPTYALAVMQDGGYGAEVAHGFAAQAHADKHNVDVVSFPDEKPDYAAAAAAIVAKKADYLFLAGKVAAMGPLVPALVAAGYKGAFGLSDGFYDVSTIKQYGEQLTGALIATSFAPLRRAPSDFILLQDLTSAIGDVTAFSAYGYAAAQIAMTAVKRSNAMDRIATLQALVTPGAPYATLTGSYTFDFSGDAIDPNIYLFSIGKDGFTYKKPAHPSGFVL
ncbi:MAG: branched-chain amino acid ABC transporter substrate-binding protein [Candidatus Eremiobacteraeota bacterium]|nr:branched-chain amino acid ABC transporter substrate-binding protein [Candidatus Eremiobacteraeota bacterium]